MITRFAPSPTGPLHLGHAYSAMLAHDMARDAGGTFLLRIEDIDQSRARPEWEALIFEDLHWLGLDWPIPGDAPVRPPACLCRGPAPADGDGPYLSVHLLSRRYPQRPSPRRRKACRSLAPTGWSIPAPAGAEPQIAGTAAIRLDMARALDAAHVDKLPVSAKPERSIVEPTASIPCT